LLISTSYGVGFGLRVAGFGSSKPSLMVKTLMRILEEKEHLSHRIKGRQFIYTTIIQPEKEGGNRLRYLLKTFFGGCN